MVTYTADQAALAYPVYKPFGRGDLAVAYGTVNLTTLLSGSNPDLLRMCRIPAGSTVLDGLLLAADLDTATSGTLSCGWEGNGVEAANAAGFIAASAMGSGAIVAGYTTVVGLRIPFQGVLITTGPQFFTRETSITLTAGGTFATGTGRVNLYVFYVTL